MNVEHQEYLHVYHLAAGTCRTVSVGRQTAITVHF